MTKRATPFRFLILLLAIGLRSMAQHYASLVNPFIGTGGHGHTFPGATLPFGMVQLSPDTRIDDSWDGCGGYHHSDSIIYGFSHTHLSGVGISDFGDILVAPTVGEPSVDNKAYSSKFSHLKEKAEAGFYEVTLNDDNIKAELTSTLRTGIHRYTFPKTDKANLIIDLRHRDKLLACNLKVIDSVTVYGFRVSEAWTRQQPVYFVMKLSKPIKQKGYAINKIFKPELDEKQRETAYGAYLQFDLSDGQPLVVKVALSMVNNEGALLNLQTEAKHWDFDKYRTDAAIEWNKQLSKIEVETGDNDKKVIFYTALYHCMIHPSIYMDVDGQYRGRDMKIHTAKGYNYYSVFSLWDTFRTLHPLLTILDPKLVNDFINTFLYQYADNRRLPMWELAGNETDCMIGYHAASVIADAYMKGIRNYDTLRVYDAMKAAASYTRFGIPAYAGKGFLQVDDEPESVSKTLEYAYDDWCIGQMALQLGQTDDYKYFMKRAQSYKNLFDPSTGFMRPRKNGNWLSPFDPSEVNNHFTEANSWQYSFFVPQDIDGLMALHGGPANLEKKLDGLFSASSATTGREQADITGLIGQYAQGNEPSHHAAYLYNYVGRPQKTIDRAHQVLNSFYKNAPDGLIGNDDCGQMSAWYVMSAMGIYPVCPGLPEYVLSAPVFDKITIQQGNGKKFVITQQGAGRYLKEVLLDGKSQLRSVISHKKIMDGGELAFVMNDKPDTTSRYGAALFSRPHTRINTASIIPVPVIAGAAQAFREKQEIALDPGLTKNANIVYTTDGSEPTKKSPLYFKPFTIDTSCTVKAKIISDKDSSATAIARFYKIHHQWKVSIRSHYSKQYTGGGDEALIDGIYGDVNWRKGDWQGYQAQDFECTIDLGAVRSINYLSSDYLQDTRSWIIFPDEIDYSVSENGKTFTPVTKIANPVPASDYTMQTRKFEFRLPAPVKAKYVKIKAKNYGKLPSWHQGAGGDAFIFIDEVEVK